MVAIGKSPEALKRLSKSKNKNILKRVAGNTYTPPDILDNLSRHPIGEVRNRVAQNTATPIEVLFKMKKDKYWKVRINATRRYWSKARLLEQNPYILH
jgi:hypothetical protein